MNFFSPQQAAERYSKGRPYFQHETIARVKEYLQLNDKLSIALDVACGTGLSSKALLAIANKVLATDSSKQMLHYAFIDSNIEYTVAVAENQPFANNIVDIITVCSGVHWFNIDTFLAEAYRLLKANGWLVLYDNFFIGEMVGCPEFRDWYYTVYLNKFPAPPRNDTYLWNKDNILPLGFNFVFEDRFTNKVLFNKEQAGLYFTTQSNIIAQVEHGEITLEDAQKWLNNQLSSFFDNKGTPREIKYGNWIKYLQAVA